MIRLTRRTLLLAGSALLLAACSTPAPPPQLPAERDAPFAVSGRMAVNYQGKGHSASFDWQHRPPRDRMEVRSPLGNVVARLDRAPGQVELTNSEGTYQSDSVENLSLDFLGWPLPMNGLVWWVRGLPSPELPVQHNADGSLQQDGWTIRWQGEPLPTRLEISRPELTVKLVLRDWRAPDPQ